MTMSFSSSRSPRSVAGVRAGVVLCSRARTRGSADVGTRDTIIPKANCCEGCPLYDIELCKRGCCQGCRVRLYNIYIAHNGHKA